MPYVHGYFNAPSDCLVKELFNINTRKLASCNTKCQPPEPTDGWDNSISRKEKNDGEFQLVISVPTIPRKKYKSNQSCGRMGIGTGWQDDGKTFWTISASNHSASTPANYYQKVSC